MRQSSLTDEQLAVRVRNGDLQAVTELYTRWKNGLFRFSLRMVSDADAAEDIIHDAFVKLIEERRSVRDPAALRSWIYTVVRNGALSFLNRSKRLRPIDNDDEDIFEAAVTESFESGEQRRQIECMLDRLLPQYKEVLLLREYESMNYEEIAAVTGSTVSSVKSRLFKARKALYKEMEPFRKESEL